MHEVEDPTTVDRVVDEGHIVTIDGSREVGCEPGSIVATIGAPEIDPYESVGQTVMT